MDDKPTVLGTGYPLPCGYDVLFNASPTTNLIMYIKISYAFLLIKTHFSFCVVPVELLWKPIAYQYFLGLATCYSIIENLIHTA